MVTNSLSAAQFLRSSLCRALPQIAGECRPCLVTSLWDFSPGPSAAFPTPINPPPQIPLPTLLSPTLSLPCSETLHGCLLTTRCKLSCPQGYWFQTRGPEMRGLASPLWWTPYEYPCPTPTHTQDISHTGGGGVLQRQKQALGAGVGFPVFPIYPLVMEEMRKMRPQWAKETCQGPGTS